MPVVNNTSQANAPALPSCKNPTAEYPSTNLEIFCLGGFPKTLILNLASTEHGQAQLQLVISKPVDC